MSDLKSVTTLLREAVAFDRAFFVPLDTPSVRAMRVNKKLAPILAALEGCVEALEKSERFLDNDIAMLPCESRQRDLPEVTWEKAMFYRDLSHTAIETLRTALERLEDK